MSESKCHWKNRRYYSTLYKVVRKIWKIFHLTTSETKTPWPTIHKIRDTVPITTTTLSARITSSGEDSHELWRWSYTTFGSSNKIRLTIINDYRTYQQSSNCGVSTAHLQQWNILEERNQETDNIRLKIIQDLIVFINVLRSPIKTLSIDSAVYRNLRNNKNRTYLIFNKHSRDLEPNTYNGGILRIYYHFFTPHIEEFIISYGVTPFDFFTSSDHWAIYLDVNILSYLKDSPTIPPNLDSRLQNPQNYNLI